MKHSKLAKCLQHRVRLRPAARRFRGETELRLQRTHFVVGPIYGTRCSTVVLVAADGTVTFAERSFDAAGARLGGVRETFTLRR